jgi:hypothetical protein
MMLATSAKSFDIDIDIDIDIDVDIDIDIDIDDDIEDDASFLVPRNASKVSSASTLFSNDLCCEWMRLRTGSAALAEVKQRTARAAANFIIIGGRCG